MLGLLKKIFDPNPKEIRRLQEMVVEINEWEPEIRSSRTPNSRGKTAEFKQRLATGRRWTTSCPRRSRSCGKRPGAPSGMRHFDVQMMGGIVLHRAASPK